MRCETAQSEIANRLTDEPERGAALSAATRAHVDSCATCRTALAQYRELWEALDGVQVAPLPPDRSRAILDRIDAGTTAPPVSEPRQPPGRFGNARPALAVAASVVLAMALGAVGSRTETALRWFPLDEARADQISPTVAGNGGGGTFLFLLHRPEQRENRLADRYQQWADELRARDMLLYSNALQSDWGWLLTRAGDTLDAESMPPPVGDIEGFFLIVAADSAAVVDAVRISPHLDYGGAIEVRRIVP